jgi:glycosyltransferase involved in cell wall biosynthesis
MRLLWFNLATDADDPLLGFTTSWIREAASHVGQLDVITMRAGRIDVPANVTVRSVGKERQFNEARRAVEFYRILTGLMRTRRYDACFAHMIPVFAVMASPLLRRQRVPITLWYTHNAITPTLRLAVRGSAHIVTASRESFRLATGKLIVTGHGIDTDFFRPSSTPPRREPLTIAVVGRVSAVKRLEMVLEGVRLFAAGREAPSLRVKFVGPVLDDSYAAGLRRRAERSGLADHIEFTGAVAYSRMPAIYQSADIVLSATGRGSFDKAPLEAMSCGVPAIVANRALDETFAGIDVPALHSVADPAELASSLASLAARSPDAIREHAIRLRSAVVEHHGLGRLMPRLLQIMSGHLDESPKRCRG